MSEEPQDEWLIAVQGIAAIAQTEVEMGLPGDQVRSHIVGMCRNFGLTAREDLVAIAETIRQHPQPINYSAEERERRRPVEEMLGVTSAEEQLSAQLHARELVLGLIELLDE